MNLTRRTLLGRTAAGLAFAGRARAQAKPKLRIGILTDMSGAFSSDSGPTAVACAQQAIDEFNPGARGMEIELLVADHQNKPDIGVGIARHWFDEEGVTALLDVNNSAIAMALISVAQDKDKLQLNTGAGTGDLTGPRCSFNTVHWGWDTYVFAKSTGGEVLRSGGKKWFFITADYAFGHASEKDATDIIQRNGGTVVGSVTFPGAGATTDFSSQILQAQSSGADVIGLATSGIDFVNIIKQSAEFGVEAKGQRIAGLSVFINDIHGLGLPAAQGIFLTETFYWDLNDRTRAFLGRVKDKVANNWPSMEQASAYSATTHYLKAVAEIGVAGGQRLRPGHDGSDAQDADRR